MQKMHPVPPSLRKLQPLGWQYKKLTSATARQIAKSALSTIDSEPASPCLLPAIQSLKDAALKIRIVVVDDSPQILTIVRRRLIDQGFKATNITTYNTPQAMLENMKDDNPDLVITDLSMPEARMNGEQLIKEIAKKSVDKPPRFILFSGNPEPTDPTDPLSQTIKEHSVQFISKAAQAQFMAAVKIIAEEIVFQISLEEITLLTQTETKIEELKERFEHNPFSVFLKIIAHKANNAIMPLDNISFLNTKEDLMDTELVADFRKGLSAFLAFAKTITDFSKMKNIAEQTLSPIPKKDLENISKEFGDDTSWLSFCEIGTEGTFTFKAAAEATITKSTTTDQQRATLLHSLWHCQLIQTSLDSKIVEHADTMDVWGTIPPNQRGKFAVITQQYVQNGLSDFATTIQRISKELFPNGLENDITNDFEVITRVQAEYTEAKKTFVQCNSSAQLRGTKGSPDLILIFTNYLTFLEQGIGHINTLDKTT
ncbi:MAG: response regulator [bacterium]